MLCFCCPIQLFNLCFHQATVAPDQPLEPDIERVFASGIPSSDPYQFRDGLIDDDTLTKLRRRGKGKRVAKYQLRQNDVSLSYLLDACFLFFSS